MTVDLFEADDPALYGNKAAGLARVARLVPVPAGIALAGHWLLDGLPPTAQDELTGLLADPEPDPVRLARVLASFELTAVQQQQLSLVDLGAPLIVRSSSADEDDADLSFAGVFDTIPDVEPAGLAAAIAAVWRSAFSPRALAQYRRIGRPPGLSSMGVLVQRIVPARVAGVAFTEPTGDAFVEWVFGPGTEVVDGRSTPTAERLAHDAVYDGWRAQLQQAVRALPAVPGGHDVEWAWDGDTVWIVQVRPRTADLPGTSTTAAGVRVAPLYEGDGHDLVLGDLGDEYGRIRAKRRYARAVALAQGAQVPGGWLVNWSPAAGPAGLRNWAAELPERLVLDSSPTERQYIIDRAELADTVQRLAAARPTPQDEFAFLCREYLHGELALLSTVAGDGSVYVESSPEGLLALNRGFGSARPMSDTQLIELLGPDQVAALRRTTAEYAGRVHPRCTLEWVVTANGLYFVDYSAPVGPTADNTAALTGARVLSPGRAGGRVQHLPIDAVLTESSIAPIISIAQPVSAANETELLAQLRSRLRLGTEPVIVAAARPIAVLSMLIGVVDGFLFEEGALLCHLGIMLREAGVPAAIVGTGSLPAEGELVELVHGTVVAAAN